MELQSLNSVSVKAPWGNGDLTGPNPTTDRGNKIGTKRYVLTDQRGIPLSVVITAANTHDMKAAAETLDRTVIERPSKNQNLCLDKGYDYPEIEREAIKRRYVPHIRHRGVEKKIDKDRIYNEEMSCFRKNKLLTQDSESY